MQKELDTVIQQGVVQITRLLRNTETGVSSGTGSIHDEDQFSINHRKQNYMRSKIAISYVVIYQSISFPSLDKKIVNVGSGRLTNRLLAQGLLTPNMLQELKKEWIEDKDQVESEKEDGDDDSKKPRRRRKIK